jgi:hypothetical protein
MYRSMLALFFALWASNGLPQSDFEAEIGGEEAELNIAEEVVVAPLEIRDAAGDLLHRFSSYGDHYARLPSPPATHDHTSPHTLEFIVDGQFTIGGVLSGDVEVVSVPSPAFAFGSGVPTPDGRRAYKVGIVLRNSGKTTLTIETHQANSRTRTELTIAVPVVDLVLEDLPEQDEETIGGVIREGDITPVELKLADRTPGYGGLRAMEFTVQTGGDHIKLWYDSARTQRVVTESRGPGSYRVWWRQPGDVPSKLYIEGLSASADHADVRVHLGPLNWGMAEPDDIGTDVADITVVRLEVDAPDALHLPGAQAVAGLAEAVLIGQNDDNDNGDPSRKDYETEEEVAAEDDLASVTVAVVPTIPAEFARTTLAISSGLALWSDASKAAESPAVGGLNTQGGEIDFAAPTGQQTFYLEGIAPGTDKYIALKLAPIYAADVPKVLSQRLPTHVVKADIDIVGIPDEGDREYTQGGNTAVPTRANDPNVARLRLHVPWIPHPSAVIVLSMRQERPFAELRDSGRRLDLDSLSDEPGTTAIRWPDAADMPAEITAPGIEGSPERAVEILLSYLAPDAAGTLVTVHSDRARLTVNPAGELVLSPIIIPVLSDPSLMVEREQLSVFYVNDEGIQSVPLEADPGTTYEWIEVGRNNPHLKPLYDEIIGKLQEFIPGIDLATVTVERGGVLVVSSRGINVIQAVRGETRSNVAVVIAGLRAKDLVLVPGLPTNEFSIFLKAQSYVGSEFRWIVLLSDKIARVGDKTTIAVKDVIFEFLAGGEKAPTIALTDLFRIAEGVAPGALGDKLGQLTGFGRLPATAVVRLMKDAVFRWIESNVQYSVQDARIASVTSVESTVTQKLAELTGISAETIDGVLGASKKWFGIEGPRLLRIWYVQAGLPGATSVTGALDLGKLGKVDDTLPIIIMPAIENVAIESDLDPRAGTTEPIIIGGEGPQTTVLHAVAQGHIIESWQIKLKRLDADALLAMVNAAKSPDVDMGLSGDIEVVAETEAHKTIAVKKLHAQWRVRNIVPFGNAVLDAVRRRLAQGEWSVEGVPVGVTRDKCFDAGWSLRGVNASCRVNGSFFDLVATAQPIPIRMSSMVEVRLVLSIFGCPGGAFNAEEEKRCTATRQINVQPPLGCQVGDPIVRMGGMTWLGQRNPSAVEDTIGTIDDRFENRPFETLLAKARDGYGLSGLGSLRAVRPGDYGPFDRGSAGWEAGWIYFIEFPVAHKEDCRLVYTNSTAAGTDLIPTVTRREFFGRPHDSREWVWQTAGQYRSANGDFTDALIYMNVVLLAPPRGAEYAVHRLEERVLIMSRRTETYLYRVGQTIQVVLRQHATGASLFTDRIKVLGGDRPNVRADANWPTATTSDLYGYFTGLAFPYLPENKR